MVLQSAPKRACLYGTYEDEKQVKVVVSGKNANNTFEAETSQDKFWKACLDPVESSASQIYDITVFGDGKGSNATIENVLFGDVWYCGGQSNMYRTLFSLSYTHTYIHVHMQTCTHVCDCLFVCLCGPV